MNILTFDIEEWYIEKVFGGGRVFKYQQFDETFNKVLDELDKLGIKATFFCVGRMATDFPDVIKRITNRGHELGCHSNVHTWLDKMDEAILRKDTTDALKALADVSGQKVVSYRAPAFSIMGKTKWAVGVLSDCGIEIDASIFPAVRDYGGYAAFPYDVPCKISYQGVTLKEYPISMVSIFGKRIAYSGGGYFRLIPYWMVNWTIKKRDYNICYFHLEDLIHEKHEMLSKKAYEVYFKEPATLKNRFVRYVKRDIGNGDAYSKLQKLLSQHPFANIQQADVLIDWEKVKTVSL